ncbi:TAXI family TRAP transporter solute-binding subunit [Variovorax sp. ZT4R33]|uniref:TAXI family TRAP transporter solute-binding subunit n=1 Tax=Variovorax sp. ZT4R33 TaxID=3443743 RepID=UPI003F464D4F
MARRFAPVLREASAALLALLCLAASGVAAAADYKIVTASSTGTYIQIGRDLSKWVAAPAGIGLEVLESKGSAENISRMRFEPGVKLALVQSDVYQAFLDEANAGNVDAGNIIRPLRLVMPLYAEEIYFVVRADSPLNFIHEIRNRKIGVGPLGSGTALTARTLYQRMFDERIPAESAQYLDNEEALARLTVEKSIDVAVIVAGQPAKLFTEMKPEARKFIKLLKFDPTAPQSQRVQGTYQPASIRTASYASWLDADVPTLSVQAYLVTYDYGLRSTVGDLVRFADSLCASFDQLQSQGHPKWKQVRLELPPLGRGWRYFAPMEKRLRACAAQRMAAAPPAAAVGTAMPARTKPCTEQELVLGICRR